MKDSRKKSDLESSGSSLSDDNEINTDKSHQNKDKANENDSEQQLEQDKVIFVLLSEILDSVKEFTEEKSIDYKIISENKYFPDDPGK